jgi:glycine/D-amino acid oxidase-like deaminating enzyme
MSPLAGLHADRKQAVARGAHFMEAEVAAITRDAERVSVMAVAARERLRAPIVVNAVGRWASKIARIVGWCCW